MVGLPTEAREDIEGIIDLDTMEKSGGKVGGGSILKKVKSSGYRIKIKYKRIEMEI
jgi:hypothetical protein